MKETERITVMFEDIYNGDPWIEINLMGTLQHISAEDAAKKITPQWNSIWEIVNHIISWRTHELKRVQGNIVKSPAGNYFSPIKDRSEKAWKESLENLENSQEQWVAFLQKLKDEYLDGLYPENSSPYYKHIHGIIQHDAYHLGQIVLLAKSINNR